MLILPHRKEKPVGQVFGHAFAWPDAIDAAADIYNGVRSCFTIREGMLTVPVCVLVNLDLLGPLRMV